MAAGAGFAATLAPKGKMHQQIPKPVSSSTPKEGPEPSFDEGFRRYWGRHRTFFWNLHSIWALANGGVVIFLAQERYGFVPWAILFLFLTWASTLFFSRSLVIDGGACGEGGTPDLRVEMASYLTRIMYQGTLFFLLPFYWYSSVIGSWNIFFFVLLAGLAVISCIDLVFDRWLRNQPLFGLIYFSTVTFAAINLLVPLLFPMDPAVATPLAGLVAVASAIPLAVRGSKQGRRNRIGLALLGALFLVLVVKLPRLIPPVPLRLIHATFTSNIDRRTLEPADRLEQSVEAGRLQGELFILGHVFAPSNLPARVSVEWRRGQRVIRISRNVRITAHALGFRLWDGYSQNGMVPPGEYQVNFRTDGERCFGVERIRVRGDAEMNAK